MKKWFEFVQRNNVELLNIFLPGARAVFSTRQGGVSACPFDTMNLAFHVGDSVKSVGENRKIFCDAWGMPLDRVVCANQVHGTNIQTLTSEHAGRGAWSQEDALPETDAMITMEPGLIPAAFFADCVPVYIVDPVKGAVGLAHAGWKGTLKGIAGKTVARMYEEFGCQPSDCCAFIGPSIGPCCYQVGEEVASLFNQRRDGHVSPAGRVNEWKLDLWGANRDDLAAAGVPADKIGISGICTRCDKRFFSYRREGGCTGRMGAFITLCH